MPTVREAAEILRMGVLRLDATLVRMQDVLDKLKDVWAEGERYCVAEAQQLNAAGLGQVLQIRSEVERLQRVLEVTPVVDASPGPERWDHNHASARTAPSPSEATATFGSPRRMSERLDSVEARLESSVPIHRRRIPGDTSQRHSSYYDTPPTARARESASPPRKYVVIERTVGDSPKSPLACYRGSSPRRRRRPPATPMSARLPPTAFSPVCPALSSSFPMQQGMPCAMPLSARGFGCGFGAMNSMSMSMPPSSCFGAPPPTAAMTSDMHAQAYAAGAAQAAQAQAAQAAQVTHAAQAAQAQAQAAQLAQAAASHSPPASPAAVYRVSPVAIVGASAPLPLPFPVQVSTLGAGPPFLGYPPVGPPAYQLLPPGHGPPPPSPQAIRDAFAKSLRPVAGAYSPPMPPPPAVALWPPPPPPPPSGAYPPQPPPVSPEYAQGIAAGAAAAGYAAGYNAPHGAGPAAVGYAAGYNAPHGPFAPGPAYAFSPRYA